MSNPRAVARNRSLSLLFLYNSDFKKKENFDRKTYTHKLPTLLLLLQLETLTSILLLIAYFFIFARDTLWKRFSILLYFFLFN